MKFVGFIGFHLKSDRIIFPTPHPVLLKSIVLRPKTGRGKLNFRRKDKAPALLFGSRNAYRPKAAFCVR